MKHFTLLITLLFAITVNAQDFPYKRPELLLEKEVTIKDIQPAIKVDFKGYENFYLDNKYTEYAKNSHYNTSYEALVGRTFKVTSVEPYSSHGIKLAWIKLEDVENAETIYYRYDIDNKSRTTYYFEVKGGLDLPEDFYCDYIEEVITENIERYTIKTFDGIEINREKKDAGTGREYHFYCALSMNSSSVGKQSTIVLTLENGKKIEKNNIIPSLRKGRVTAFFYLTEEDLDLLQESNIVTVTIGPESEKIFFGADIQNPLKCLRSK